MNARDSVDAIAAHAREDFFHHAFVAQVAIVIRVLEQRAALVEQGVVDAPGVHADAVEAHLPRAIERARDVAPQAERVPPQRAILAERLVREAADFVNRERAVLGELRGDGASAFRPEIEGEVLSRHADTPTAGA